MKHLRLLILGLCPVFAFAAPQALVINKEQSKVEIVVKATVDSFTAKLANYDAVVSVEPGAAQVDSAVFTFHFADVKTGKDARDTEMLKWQGTDKNPDGTFTLSKIDPTAGGHFTAHGTLKFHGVSREMIFPVSVTMDGKLYAIDGEVALDTQDYGLPIIRKFLMLKVDPLVTVRFHLQGTLAQG
jgi:polyisoprenoid-binding protein YceI